jgi:esterase/lipase superfamily enzyme
MPTPNIYSSGKKTLFEGAIPELKNNKIEVVYATDRAQEIGDDSPNSYGFARSNSVSFGVVTIEIGDNESWDVIEQLSTLEARNQTLPLKIIKINELGSFPPTPHDFEVVDGSIRINDSVKQDIQESNNKFLDFLTGFLSKSKSKRVVVYIHGYNNGFKEAAYTLGELWHFLGREDVPLLYTWPAGRGGIKGYAYDRESGEFTVFHLKNLIKALGRVDAIDSVTYIAHSRGTDILVTALRELMLESRASSEKPAHLTSIDNVILAASDLDIQIISQRVIAEGMFSEFGRLTIYTSTEDRALGVSKFLFDSVSRLGVTKAEDAPSEVMQVLDKIPNIDVVENRAGRSSFFGHGYFHSDPAASSDLINVIRYSNKPEDGDERPLKRIHSRFWYFDENYLK